MKKTRPYFENFGDFIYAIRDGWNYKADDKRHIESQASLITDLDGSLLVDKVYKFENFEEHFKELAELLKIGDYTLNKINSSNRKRHYSSYYKPELVKIIEELYAKDIEMFNYKFETRSIWQDFSTLVFGNN